MGRRTVPSRAARPGHVNKYAVVKLHIRPSFVAGPNRH